MTAPTYEPEVIETVPEHVYERAPRPAGPISLRAARPLSPVPTYAGILIAAIGLVLIGVAWSQVAGEANVARQIPYVVSGGIFGLALVLIGALVVSVASKRRETELRERQTRLLADALQELGRALDVDLAGDDPYRP
jgi:hypothetical protein